jgi:hypothetical protein
MQFTFLRMGVIRTIQPASQAMGLVDGVEYINSRPHPQAIQPPATRSGVQDAERDQGEGYLDGGE